MLQVRQTTTAGTRHSKRGDRVSAVLIAPVLSDGQTVIPPGSLLEGEVRDSIRLGLGLRHHTASMDVRFRSLRFPDGDTPAKVSSFLLIRPARVQADYGSWATKVKPPQSQ